VHLYWRIIEELKFIGETWTFTDPGFQRHYERWVKKNAAALAIMNISETAKTSTLYNFKGAMVSLN
jgi:hypothetical protein